MGNDCEAHKLKTWPAGFEALRCGKKTADFWKNDRSFAVDDVLVLREWNPYGYTGRVLFAKITHIESGFGIPDGYVMLSLAAIRELTVS